jgi:D-alanine-D-alanine ligase
MSGRTRVAVIGGGTSCEHDVSIASAASVGAALDPGRFAVLPLTIGRDGCWSTSGASLGPTPAASLARAVDLVGGCDVVLPAVHGPHGEDGVLAALCELAGVPCVGSPVRAGALAMDKVATKLLAESLGIATAAGVVVTPATASGLRWTGPVVVKPIAAGSSHGLALVTEEASLAPALEAALRLDDRVLVEEVVTGREIDIAVLATPGGGRVTGPPLEIVVPAGRLFDTTTKYDGMADFRLPAPMSDSALAELRRHAVAMFDALGCAGVARVDFFSTGRGWVLNEVNTMPGMTEQSQVPKMFAAAGTPYPQLLAALVDEALAR